MILKRLCELFLSLSFSISMYCQGILDRYVVWCKYNRLLTVTIFVFYKGVSWVQEDREKIQGLYQDWRRSEGQEIKISPPPALLSWECSLNLIIKIFQNGGNHVNWTGIKVHEKYLCLFLFVFFSHEKKNISKLSLCEWKRDVLK